MAPQFANPPGYVGAGDGADAESPAAPRGVAPRAVQTKDGRPVNPRTMTVEERDRRRPLLRRHAGRWCSSRSRRFYGHVGGFGHLLMMGQGGHISHEDTVANLTMFSREVLPRLAELG